MIIWFGTNEVGRDDQITRISMKNKALQDFFKDYSIPKSINMLNEGDLAAKPKSFFSFLSATKKESLIINAHGNQHSIAYFTAKEVAQKLVDVGLNSERFDKIYLMVCDIGKQAQNNSITMNFAKQFKYSLEHDHDVHGINIYAPRGELGFFPTEETVSSPWGDKTYRTCDEIVILTPEREYALDDGGLLLVHS